MTSLHKNLIILGAGQYGQVAKEIAESMRCFEKIAFLDDSNENAIGKLSEYERFSSDFGCAFVAIGNSDLRLEYIDKLEKAGYEVAVLISSCAYVSPSAQLMKGVIVEPMAVVNAHSSVGVGVFVCVGATVNHNTTIGDGCQLDCGSVVGSNVNLPKKTKLKYNEVFDKESAVAVNRG